MVGGAVPSFAVAYAPMDYYSTPPARSLSPHPLSPWVGPAHQRLLPPDGAAAGDAAAAALHRARERQGLRGLQRARHLATGVLPNYPTLALSPTSLPHLSPSPLSLTSLPHLSTSNALATWQQVSIRPFAPPPPLSLTTCLPPPASPSLRGQVLRRCGYVWRQYLLSPVTAVGLPNHRMRFYMLCEHTGGPGTGTGTGPGPGEGSGKWETFVDRLRRAGADAADAAGAGADVEGGVDDEDEEEEDEEETAPGAGEAAAEEAAGAMGPGLGAEDATLADCLRTHTALPPSLARAFPDAPAPVGAFLRPPPAPPQLYVAGDLLAQPWAPQVSRALLTATTHLPDPATDASEPCPDLSHPSLSDPRLTVLCMPVSDTCVFVCRSAFLRAASLRGGRSRPPHLLLHVLLRATRRQVQRVHTRTQRNIHPHPSHAFDCSHYGAPL